MGDFDPIVVVRHATSVARGSFAIPGQQVMSYGPDLRLVCHGAP